LTLEGAGSKGWLRDVAAATDFDLIIFRGVCGEFLFIESVVGAGRLDTGGAKTGPFEMKGEFILAELGARDGCEKVMSGALRAGNSVLL
jgi:hypothetical protein